MNKTLIILFLAFFTTSCGEVDDGPPLRTHKSTNVSKRAWLIFPNVIEESEGRSHLKKEDYLAGPMPSGLGLQRAALKKMAKKAGDNIHWLYDFDEALKIAKQQKRPIFLSMGPDFKLIEFDDNPRTSGEHRSMVVPGSPTFRGRDYDVHLRLTLFSYPSTVELINRKFIPLRLHFKKNMKKLAAK